MSTPSNSLDAILTIEGGEASWTEFCEAFQSLIDSGVVWQLQGSYGRTATTLIEEGYCHAATETDKE
jgi:hypothetical protein